jgi:hypothetical protein
VDAVGTDAVLCGAWQVLLVLVAALVLLLLLLVQMLLAAVLQQLVLAVLWAKDGVVSVLQLLPLLQVFEGCGTAAGLVVVEQGACSVS